MSARSGLLIVDKPAGMTSHDVVARVRRAIGTRKVGHAGTLDPMATGLLVIGVERATRLLGLLALKDKAYSATIRLGATTVTDDAEGEVTAAADPAVLAAVIDDAIRSAVRALTGSIEQRPSAVSAIKVDGRRAYDRVRAGEDVELAARAVTVSRFDVVAVDRRASAIDLDVEVDCSTGTYVRALARDLGSALGVGGHLTRLRRTRVGPFEQTEAVSLVALADHADPESLLMPMGAVAAQCFASLTLPDAAAADVSHGRPIAWPADVSPADDLAPLALLAEDGDLLALATERDGRARYLAVFRG